VVDRITITGRILNEERELFVTALAQLREFSRREGCVIITAQQVPKPMPDFIEIDYAELERRMVERFVRDVAGPQPETP